VNELPPRGSCRCFCVNQSRFIQSGKKGPSTQQPNAKASTSAAGQDVPASAAATDAVAPVSKPDASSSDSESIWSIPLAIGSYVAPSTSSSTPSVSHTSSPLAITQRILSNRESVIELDADTRPGTNDASPVVYSFNHDSTGFYRVCYSADLFRSLCSLIRVQGILPPLDRLALLRDVLALSACDRGYSIRDLCDLLQLLGDATRETNYSIRTCVATAFQQICTLHSGESYKPLLESFVRKVFGSRWQQLGWGPSASERASSDNAAEAPVSEHHLTFLERAQLVQMLGFFGGEEAAKPLQQEAWRMLNAFKDDPVGHAIQPDLRQPLYRLAIQEKGQEARDLLISLYHSSASSEERVRILSSLGSTNTSSATSDAEVRQLLDWIFNSGHVRNGDLIYALTTLGQDSKRSRQLCWEYIKQHWEDVVSRFRGAMFVLGRIFIALLGEMSSEEEAADFEAFFATHPAPGAERGIRQASETVRMKAARLIRERPILEKWLNEHIATQQ